jgi:iron complex transport system substrate-binding protein
MEKMITLIPLLFSSIALCSCGQTRSSNQSKVLIDDTGETFEIPEKEPANIICVSKAVTSFLHYLGKDSSLIGVHKNVAWDAWDKILTPSLVKLATYPKKPSVEAVFAVGCDCVILEDKDQALTLRKSGIFSFCFNPANETAFANDIQMVGKLFGENGAAKTSDWFNQYTNDINKSKKAVENLSNDEKHRVYYINAISSSATLYSTYGKGSVIDNLVTASGGSLVTDFIDQEAVTSGNTEEIIKTNPDTIVIGGFFDHTLKTKIESDPLWSNVDAVVNKRIFVVPEGFGPWVEFGIEFRLVSNWLTNLLYPSLFEYDGKSTIKSFYKQCFDFELNDQQVDYISESLLPDGTTPK